MTWKNVPDEFTIKDIGAQLLANLAKGIYSFEAVLREYVQNACDAYRLLEAHQGVKNDDETIRINIESVDSISIHDNGIGMDMSDIKNAKRIAVSDKDTQHDMIGFRGIGIWAGFQACSKLEVTTSKKGDPHRYRLQINFGEILTHVNENIDIKELLDGRFKISESDAPVDDHYTRVKLSGLDQDYQNLTDEEEVKRIVSQVLPTIVSPTFKYATQLGEFLENLDGYESYRIEVNGSPVYKSFPETVIKFNSTPVLVNGAEIGKAWWASGNGSLKPDERQYQYKSFRLRVRNIAVGSPGIYNDFDASALGLLTMRQLPSSEHLNWHVGEIYLTDTEVKPDTPRSALQLDSKSRRAIESIREFYHDRIADSRAASEFNTYVRQLEASENLTKNGTVGDAEQARKLLKQLDDQLELTRSRSTTDKVKKKKRDLVNNAKYKERLKKQILLLKKSVPAASGSATTHKKGKAGKSKKATAAPPSAAFDVEGLISAIYEVIKEHLGSDEELYQNVSRQIFKLFAERGLIDAAE
jgi:hypothetical protein